METTRTTRGRSVCYPYRYLIYQTWAGKTAKEYKQFKGRLKKDGACETI